MHSRLTSPRWYSAGAAVNGSLYLFGSEEMTAQGTTERLDDLTSGVWTPSFSLRSKVSLGCSVQISESEIVTIAGNKESSRVMHHYNLLTGDVTRYNVVPPTQVFVDHKSGVSIEKC